MIGLGLKLTAQQQADNNLIFNGDFATGNLSGWSTMDNNIGSNSPDISYELGELVLTDPGDKVGFDNFVLIEN